MVGLTGIGSPASAALYAAVSGSGTTCTSGSPCTLAQVLSSATSGDTVDLAPGTYQPAGGTSFTISTSITVQPATPGSTVTLEGNGASVLAVDSSVTATVSGLSIENGFASLDGGGIDNSGTLTVEDSTIANNGAQYAGGGIYNSGTLTVEDSTISGSSAGAGGGIYNADTLTVEDSTISANAAIACVGGVDSSDDSCTAPFDGGGGGVYNQGTGTIEASTVSANSVTTSFDGAFGGGINNSDDNSLTLAADIIAKQSAGGDCSNSSNPVTDAGYNVDDDGTCGLGTSNNSISNSTVIDDYLGTLGANGGPTETVPLLASPSPTTSSADPALGAIPATFDLPIAVNGVSLACSIPDQRGVTPDQPCDVGAFTLPLDTVAFVADGGGPVASITGLDGSSTTLPSDTYPGYKFIGWFTAASGGIEVGGAGASYAIPLGGVLLYAQWSANPTDDYSFNAAGGAPTPTAGSGLDGTTITLPGAPTLAAYVFVGWNDGTTTYGAGATYTLSSGGKAIVFTAQWIAATDDYSFNAAGGAPTPAAGSGLNGTTITLPAAPTQAGYTFAGWSAGTSNPSGEMAPPAGYSASQEVLEDQFANLSNWNTYFGPGTPWQNKGRLPSPYSGGNQPDDNDMAYYSPTQDVLMSGGGVSLEATPNSQFSSQGYTWESGVLTSKNPLPSTGWYVQVKAQMPDTSAGFWPAIWALPSSSAQELDGFEGGWPGTSPNEQGHSDTFASSGQIQQVWPTPGGVNVSSGYNTYGFQYIPGTGMRFYFNGTEVYSSSADLVPESYYLFLQLQVAAAQTSGWHTTGGTTPGSMQIAEVQVYSSPPPSYYAAGATYTLSSGGTPIVFTAQWTANATDNYSFSAAGGTPTPASGSGLNGTTITLPTAPTRAGYTFTGWNTGTTTYGAGATYTLSSGGNAIVFTAQWAANATDKYSFNTAGGAPTPTAGSGLDGTTITLPTGPTLAGYTFAGWNDGTTTYGAGATYTLSSDGGAIVFTAQWTANATDNYSFNTAGGTPTPTAGSGLNGTTITLPAAPTLAGYTFAGWNDGTTTYGAGATYTLSSGGSAIVFTAQWSGTAEKTTTGLSLSKTSITYGAESTESFTVTVTGQAGDGYPMGTVTIYNSSTTLCGVTLTETTSDSASASCSPTVTELSVGSYSDVFATYTPAASSSSNASFTYTTSGSTPAKSFSVTKDTTVTTVSESPTSVNSGSEAQAVFTATVKTHHGEAVPTGETVTVKVGSVTCTVTLNSAGQGSCTIGNSALRSGTYAVSASYGGDTKLSGSSGSAATGLTVRRG